MSLELLLLAGCIGALAAFTWMAIRPWRQQQAERERLSHLVGEGEDETLRDVAPTPAVSRFRRMLLGAGIEVKPPIALAVMVLVAGLFAAALVLSIGGGLLLALVAGAFALWLFFAVISEISRWRVARFEQQFVDWVDLAAGALSTGLEPIEAFSESAEAAEPRVKNALQDFIGKLRASMPIESALRRLSEQYDSESVRMFTQLMIAKWEVGGELAPALRDIARTARHGIRLRKQLQSSLSGAQIAAIIVSVVPYIVLLGLIMRRPDVIARAWQLSWVPSLFFAGVILQFIGFLWLRRMTRIDV